MTTTEKSTELNEVKNQVKTFEIGKTYYTRSLCDYNCIFAFTVISRTAKTIKIVSKGEGEGVTRKIKISENVEWVFPNGSYSMAPTIGADDTNEKP